MPKHQVQSNLYIGLMSGTSADGIDLALVDFSTTGHQLVASYYQAYDNDTQAKIIALYRPGADEIDRAGLLDKLLAQQFARAINTFIQQQNLTSADIKAIGNHGQTIRHRPTDKFPFTLQIGCNQTLACLTNIKVIGKFRDKDIALGGQGAPLVPAYHQAIFANANSDVCVVNIGGISNITFLPKQGNTNVSGFDTGPGNALLDDWYRLHHQDCPNTIDLDGKWAATGAVHTALLAAMLADNYFSLAAPKSTGREYFHLNWLTDYLAPLQLSEQALTAADVQITLMALTCQSIATTINSLSSAAEVIICGGGANNPLLMNMLTTLCDQHLVTTATSMGIANDSLEALVFAWLAFAFDNNINGNLPKVTGASRATTLGLAFYP